MSEGGRGAEVGLPTLFLKYIVTLKCEKDRSVPVMSEQIKGSMVTGNPTRALIGFTLPMVAGNLFQQFYNIMDSVIVGNVVGEEALAAVGASTAITMMFVMVAMGTGIGCSVVISQLFGAKKLEEMKTAISTALLSILGFSIFLSMLGLVINRGLMDLMGTPENIFEDAAEYMQIYFFGFVFLFLYNAFSAIFNALGDSGKPLMFLIFSSLLNIGLDLYFVAELHMGVAGVAWATLIAQGISALLSFGFLMWKLKGIETERYRRFDPALLKNMVKVAGAPPPPEGQCAPLHRRGHRPLHGAGSVGGQPVWFHISGRLYGRHKNRRDCHCAHGGCGKCHFHLCGPEYGSPETGTDRAGLPDLPDDGSRNRPYHCGDSAFCRK